MTFDLSRQRLDASVAAPGDVLEQLTAAHADMMERHGPLLGLGAVEPPTGAKTFEEMQAALAAEQDAEPHPARRMALMQMRQAREHEQIGRLASFVAGYELAHGDRDNAAALMELGGSHFDVAGEIRANMTQPVPAAINQNSKADMAALIPPVRLASISAAQDPANGRDGQSY